MQKSMSFWVLLVLPYLLAASFVSEEKGYTRDIEAEKEPQFAEIWIKPPKIEKVDYTSSIFTENLSREFKQRYNERFQTLNRDSETFILQMNTAYDRRVVEESLRRQEFADYMVKRLLEFHVDQFVRQDPSMRTIYEVKQRMEKVELRVNKETKLDVLYSLSGNILDVILTNPYFEETKITYRMDPRIMGPTPPLISEYRLGKKLAEKYWLLVLYEDPVQAFQISINQRINRFIWLYYSLMTVGTPTDRNPLEPWVDPLNGQPYLRYLNPVTLQAGLGWTF